MWFSKEKKRRWKNFEWRQEISTWCEKDENIFGRREREDSHASGVNLIFYSVVHEFRDSFLTKSV